MEFCSLIVLTQGFVALTTALNAFLKYWDKFSF